jgi:uncharacterized protein (UPF0335 family)
VADGRAFSISKTGCGRLYSMPVPNFRYVPEGCGPCAQPIAGLGMLSLVGFGGGLYVPAASGRFPVPRGTETIWRKCEELFGMAAKAGIAADRLKSFIERIERLEEEKAALAADIREVYAEAKGTGFDTKVMRQIIRLRRMDKTDRQEQEELLELYKRALDIE